MVICFNKNHFVHFTNYFSFLFSGFNFRWVLLKWLRSLCSFIEQIFNGNDERNSSVADEWVKEVIFDTENRRIWVQLNANFPLTGIDYNKRKNQRYNNSFDEWICYFDKRKFDIVPISFFFQTRKIDSTEIKSDW